MTNNGDGAPYAVVNSVGDGSILFSAEPYACETSRAMAVPFSSAGGFGQAVVIDPNPTASAASLNPPACQCGGEQVQVGQGIVATALSNDTFVAAWEEERDRGTLRMRPHGAERSRSAPRPQEHVVPVESGPAHRRAAGR